MRFTWHMFLRSLLLRRSRSITALAAVTVAATIATALLNLYATSHSGLAKEFRGFGANVAITGDSVDLASLPLRTGESALPLAYAPASTDSKQAVVVVGTDLAQLIKFKSGWKLEAPAQGNAFVGRKAAGMEIRSITVAGRSLLINPSAIVSTGDADESRIFVSLEDFRRIAPDAKVQGVMLAIPGEPDHVRSRIVELRNQLPRYSIEPVRSIVETQATVLSRMHSVMVLSSALIAIIAALSLWASLTASIFERRRDFAVLKALGASHLSVSSMFLLEQGAIALVGGTLGYLLGYAVAALITYRNFHVFVAPQVRVFPWILLVAGAIVLIGSLVPLARLQRIQPAAILKGE